jgi:hypothetical protein
MLQAMINEKVENIVSIDWFIRLIRSVYKFFYSIWYVMLAKMDTRKIKWIATNTLKKISFAFNVQN